MDKHELKKKMEDALWGENSQDFSFVYNALEEIAPQLFKYIDELEDVCDARYHLIKGYERIVDEKNKEIETLKSTLNDNK